MWSVLASVVFIPHLGESWIGLVVRGCLMDSFDMLVRQEASLFSRAYRKKREWDMTRGQHQTNNCKTAGIPQLFSADLRRGWVPIFLPREWWVGAGGSHCDHMHARGRGFLWVWPSPWGRLLQIQWTAEKPELIANEHWSRSHTSQLEQDLS